ncbi:MAG: Zn-dependent hydrolase, partial [Chloroflexi bacterium]|nr:Zn-dependent hydrolase [Chloroflexota bacterium]
MTLLINSDRFKEDFDQLAQIGSTGDGGVNRPALSAAHLEARAWFSARAASAGLRTQTDSAGNVSAILQSPISNLQSLLLGSHTDSVPNGGRFDGALGVVAALEVLRTIKESGVQLKVNLEAINFTDEEGTLVGLLGSSALVGGITPESLGNPRGGRSNLEAGLARAHLTESGILNAKRDPNSIAGYLELHIEQGPRLAQSAIKIGVVAGIVGITSYRMKYIGAANHAGTTPMETRSDAGLGASALTLTAREMVMRDFPNCVVNVGQMNFKPGAFNIIPGVAEFSLEFRSPESKQLKQLEASLLGLAEVIARQFRLK